jgi:hypothetical protein
MPATIMGLGSRTQIAPHRLFKKRSQTLKTPNNPDFNKLEPIPPRCKVDHSRTPLQNMSSGAQRDSAMRNLADDYDSDDENGKAHKVRQKLPNSKPAYTYPMILEVLKQFDDPQERKDMFKGELEYLQRWPAKTIDDELMTPDWMRQLRLAIQDEEWPIQQRRSERDCSRMTDTFAQSMALTPQPQRGAPGRAAGHPSGRAAPTPGVRGICKGTKKPTTSTTGKRSLTWGGDDDQGRPLTGPSGSSSPHQNGNSGRPPSGRPGKGSIPNGTPPPLPPRQTPASGTVVTGRSPATSSSDHINEAVDPSNARFHANRGYANGQASGKIAVNGAQTSAAAAGPSSNEKKPLHNKNNDKAGQDAAAGRKPARPSRPRRLTESVDEWMNDS